MLVVVCLFVWFPSHSHASHNHYGFYYCHTRGIEKLENKLKGGLKPEHDGSSLLREAAGDGCAEAVEVLLQYGADTAWGYGDPNQLSPMETAISYSENPEVIELLLEAGAKLREPGRAPPFLIAAGRNKNVEVLKRLVAAGVDTHAKNSRGRDAVWKMIYDADRLDKAKYLSEIGFDLGQCSYLLAAASEGPNVSNRVFKYMLDRAETLDCRDGFNRTPLMLAAREGDYKKLSILISMDANTDLEDRRGMTALDHAMEEGGSTKAVRILRREESDPGNKENLKRLFKAIQSNDNLEVIQETLDQYGGARVRDDQGRTPLMHLFLDFYASGSSRKVSLLLENGAYVNARDDSGWTPLIYAVRQNGTRKSIFETLVDSGAEVRAQDEDGWNALMHAIACRSQLSSEGYPYHSAGPRQPCFKRIYIRRFPLPELADWLMKKGGDPNTKNEGGNTSLHIAARYATDTPVLQKLLDHGARVNAKNDSGRTPLIRAARYNDIYTIPRLLYRAGTDTTVRDIRDKSALDYMNEQDVYRGLDSLEEPFDIFEAVKKDDLQRVNELIQLGQEVNVHNEQNLSLLHIAARYSEARTVQYLLDAGADTRIRAGVEMGWRPIIDAAGHNDPSVLKVFLDHGASPKSEDHDPHDPLRSAIRANKLEHVRLLLAHGADTDTDLTYEKTYLHEAAEHAGVPLISLLLEKGLRTNVEQKNEWTPLMYAVKYNSLEVVKYLVEVGGSNVHLKNDSNNSVHQIALKNDRSKIARFIKRKMQSTEKESAVEQSQSSTHS